jgi:PAS domain S-box-containing protein
MIIGREAAVERPMSHRATKPILLGLLAVILPGYIGLLTSLNLARYERMTVSQAQRYLSILARAQASHLEGVFQGLQTEMEIAAAHPAVRRAFSPSAEPAAAQAGPNPLEDMRRRLGSLVACVCQLDPAGRIVGVVPDNTDIVKLNSSAGPEVRPALQRRKATISESLTLPNGSKAVWLCVPANESGRVTGWLCTVIPLHAINTLIGPIRTGISGYAWIVDRHGDLIAYPDDSLLGRSVFALRLRELGDPQQDNGVIDRMLKGVAGVDRLASRQSNGGTTTMAWSPLQIADSHWTVAVCIDETDPIGAPLQEQARDMILMMVCVMAALTLGAVLYFRFERKKTQLAAHLAIGRVNDELQLLSFEHTQTEQDLQAKLDALRGILDGVPYGLYWKDRSGIYRGANAAFARMVGLGCPDEIRGKTEADLTRNHGWNGPTIQYDREVIQTGIGLVNMERRQTIQGKSMTLLTSKIPLRDGRGSVWGMLGVVADITDARQKRDKYEELQDMMRRILDRIPTGIAAADASGTIRQISGAAADLLGRPRSDWVGRNLTELAPPAHRDQVQAGMDELRRAERSRPVSIRFSAGQQDIQAHLSSLVRQGRIEGFWMTLTDITEYTRGQDGAESAPYKTRQYLVSLSHRIRAAMTGILGFAEILKQEQAPGTGQSHLTQITENAQTLMGVADELARLCGSEAAPQAPEPATAETTTGAVPPSDSPDPVLPAASAEPAAANPPQESRTGPVILVVDDVAENRSLLEVILSRAGYRIETAVNAQEAIEKSSQRRYDLILMDMQMPIVNGIDATRRIRAEGPNRMTTILAMTASIEKGDEMKCLEAGCDDFVGKPVKKDLLLRKIWRSLQQARQIEAAQRGEPIVSFLAGDPDYQKTIETFVGNLPGRLEEMRTALEEGNLNDLALKAHALKGLGGFAGFAVFTEKARILEGTIQEHDLARIRFELDEMSDLCRRTRIEADGPMS